MFSVAGFDMQTSWERFRDAVVVLAGSGPVKQRLADAYQAHLQDLGPEDVPRELRAPYSAVVSALQSVPRTGSLDTVSASVRKMSEADAARHAQAIVRVFAGMFEAPAASRPATVLRAVPLDDDVPAFLNRA